MPGMLRFIRNLLAPPNPTLGWERDPTRLLELDLDSDSISGVALGASFEELAFMGPAQRSERDPELWHFPALGVTVEAQDFSGNLGSSTVTVFRAHNLGMAQ